MLYSGCGEGALCRLLINISHLSLLAMVASRVNDHQLVAADSQMFGSIPHFSK